MIKRQNLPVLISVIVALLAIPLTLVAVKINQDNRSQAMIERTPLPTIRPLSSPAPAPFR